MRDLTTGALPATSLKEVGRKAGITVGVALQMRDYVKPATRDLVRHDFESVTPEFELALTRVTTPTGDYDFGTSDRYVDALRRDGLAVYGHPLIWQAYLRPWIESLSKEGATALLDRHCEAMTARYAGRVAAWNVVNEPCSFWRPNVDGLRVGPFSNALGEPYIGRAFRQARKGDPNARLVLNEAVIELPGDAGIFYRKRLLQVIDRLIGEGAPLQAVGLQGHIRPRMGLDLDGYAKLLEDIERRNLDIYITELDVEDTTFPDDIGERDRMVAAVYAQFLGRALASRRVKRLTIWNLTDDRSFMNEPSVRKGPRPARPVLYDGSGVRKPAWNAVYEALAKAPKR